MHAGGCVQTNDLILESYMRGNWIFKLSAILLLFGLSAASAIGQTHVKDSVVAPAVEIIYSSENNVDSIPSLVTVRSDSLQRLYNGKLSRLDSLQSRVVKNSLIERSNHQIDSIQWASPRSDNLKGTYQNKLSSLDSATVFLKNKLDSLTRLNLPPNKISKRLDSLNALRENIIANFEKKLQSLKDSATSKLKTLELPPELSDKVSSLTKNINDVKIPGSELNVPLLNTPSNPLANVNDISNLNGIPQANIDNPLQAGITEKVGDVKIPDGMDKAKELTNGQGNLNNVSKVTDKASEYSKEAQEVAKGNLDQTQNFSKVAEEKAIERSGINELEKQAGGLDQYQDMTTKAQDPVALKKEAIEKAKKAAVNHFAGKEEQLKAAMEKIAKYKQKYSSLDGVKELSQKRPNEMRDKPLIERVVPGIALQFQKKGDNLLLDFNPYLGYRFTERVRAGLGWNQRVGYNTKQNEFNNSVRIHGPRVFGRVQTRQRIFASPGD